MSWISGAMFQPDPGPWEWIFDGWEVEPPGLVLGVEAKDNGSHVACQYFGNWQPTSGEEEITGNPYKRLFIGVGVRAPGASFYVFGVP